jgi:hypothetical protein
MTFRHNLLLDFVHLKGISDAGSTSFSQVTGIRKCTYCGAPLRRNYSQSMGLAPDLSKGSTREDELPDPNHLRMEAECF